jgi:hypothetical protein
LALDVAVYQGASLTNLIFVAGNDEDYLTEVDGDSTAYFNATAGTTYQIVVDGYDGNSGDFRLSLTLGSADPVPANDDFANRILVTGTNTTVTGSNIGATLEADEPLHRGYYGGKSVWWRWTAPGPGFVTIDTVGSLYDTLLAVYTGSSISNLTEIASDDDSGGDYTSLVMFPTKSNLTYQIAGILTNGFRLLLTGPTNITCALERSADLANWTSLQTNLVTSNPFEFWDTTASDASFSFYRTRRVQ